jgi:hypothetical protein
MSESEWDHMPALDVIVDSEEEDEDEDYLPALLKVPDEEELTDDEEGSDSEDGSNQFERTPVARRMSIADSSPLSAAPTTSPHTPTARRMPIADSSPLSAAPATSPHTPTTILGNTLLSSSPMYTPCAEAKFTAERATQRRLHTVQTLKDTAAAEKKAADAAKAQELEDAKKEMNAYCDEVLSSLEERGYSLADLMEYVFNPTTWFQNGYDS